MLKILCKAVEQHVVRLIPGDGNPVVSKLHAASGEHVFEPVHDITQGLSRGRISKRITAVYTSECFGSIGLVRCAWQVDQPYRYVEYCRQSLVIAPYADRQEQGITRIGRENPSIKATALIQRPHLRSSGGIKKVCAPNRERCCY